MNKALLVIAKRPAAGETKTRLCPPFTIDEAARLYECFLRDTLALARRVPDVTHLVAFAPDDASAYFKALAPDFDVVPQIGRGLGERLDNALTRCLRSGFNQAVILDSDSPTLPTAYVASAFELLEDADVVLGPCDDGGYYLIGLKRPQPRLLREVQMSTSNVLRDTLALAREDGLHVALLPEWYDVDTDADFKRLTDELGVSGEELARHTRDFLRDRASPSRVEGNDLESSSSYPCVG